MFLYPDNCPDYMKPSCDAVIITRGNQHLTIIYDKSEYGLWKYFQLNYSDYEVASKKMDELIQEHTEEAFFKAIIAIDRNHFVLNIADVWNYDPFPLGYEEEETEFYKMMTLRFVPIIKMFLEHGVKEEWLYP